MKRIQPWVPVAVWMAIIFVMSARSSVSVSEEYALNFLFFKTLHLIEYAVLFTLVFRALSKSGGSRQSTMVPLYAFVLTVVYAAFDEIHQMYVPSREGTVRDVIIDALGGAIAWFLIVRLRPNLPQTLRRWLGN